MQIHKILLRDFPNIKMEIEKLLEKQYSLRGVMRHYNGMGYIISETSIRNLFIRLGITPPKKKTYSGERNGFYGKHHSSETRAIISYKTKKSGRMKGKNNFFYGKRGELSPSWKGGKSSKQALFYASPSWYKKRLEIMTRDRFTCVLCGYTPKSNRNSLNVHHIIPISKNWKKRLTDKNLVTLCVPCHKKTFGKENVFACLLQDIVRTL